MDHWHGKIKSQTEQNTCVPSLLPSPLPLTHSCRVLISQHLTMNGPHKGGKGWVSGRDGCRLLSSPCAETVINLAQHLHVKQRSDTQTDLGLIT